MPSYNGEDNQDVSPGTEPVTASESPFPAPENEKMTAARPLTEKEPEAGEDIQPELEAGIRAGRPNFLTATRFVDFDLPPEIAAGIDNAGFEYCTPIQAQAIPVAMSGQDIAGQAQTGTGKTTAFLVPLFYRLLKNKPLEPNVPRAIIVTPTRELALQIHEDALVLAGVTSLRQVLVIGGMDYKEQADLLATAPEIVICTPGRIIDYLQQGVFKTKGIEVAVVDEADRLLDMGFIKDLKFLLGKLPPFTHRQTMLFSATLDERVLELTYQFMNPPQFITAEPDKNTRVNIEQELYHVGRDEKLLLLLGLLRREPHRRVIIFSNTKSGVEWLAKKLTMNGFQAEGITGDLPQPKRLNLMEAFKEDRLQILVATDVASRGIHVDDVSHVYNYDLPQDAENYVHRIGRTARAGHEGKAVSFGCEDYVFHLEAIENLLGEKIPVHWAEQEMFLEDMGGEVRLKDRRGGDRKRGAPSRGGAGGRECGPPRVSRGPAKSQRSGGIFGLAPRSAVEGADLRQTLGWSPNGEPTPVIEGEFEEITVAEAEASADEQAREGRRRKRRRGRRSRQPETGAESPAKPDNAGEEAAAAKVDVEALPKPEAGEKDKKPKRPEREKSRYPRKRASESRATESEGRPMKEEAAGQTESVPETAPVQTVLVQKAETAKAPVSEKPKIASQRTRVKKSESQTAAGAGTRVAEPAETKKHPKAEQDKKIAPTDKTVPEPAKKLKVARAAAKKAEDSPAVEIEAKKPAAKTPPVKKAAVAKTPQKGSPDGGDEAAEAKRPTARKPATKKAETADASSVKKVAVRKSAAAKAKAADDKSGEKVAAKKPKAKKTESKNSDESAPKAPKKPRKTAAKKEDGGA